MKEQIKEIAEKYVHGLHDALTDSQEKKDMIEDINNLFSDLKQSIEDLKEKYDNAYDVQIMLDKDSNGVHQMNIKKHFKLVSKELNDLLTKLQ